MMRVADLSRLESEMRERRGWKRLRFCAELGISFDRLKRNLDGEPESEIKDKTLALACAAVNAGMKPYGE